MWTSPLQLMHNVKSAVLFDLLQQNWCDMHLLGVLSSGGESAKIDGMVGTTTDAGAFNSPISQVSSDKGVQIG